MDPDVVGRLAITWPADGKPDRMHAVDLDTGTDLAPMTSHVIIEVRPGNPTCAWLSMRVHPETGVTGLRKPGAEQMFRYEVERMETAVEGWEEPAL